MHGALDGLKIWKSQDVLEGIDTFDDAGIYRLSDDVALVQTVDFFTPIVDDPYAFGQIAAANSLSDVYAMGGRPISALNILCCPAGDLELERLHEILQGGADKLEEAQCSLLGGHTVQDKELKFGYAVTGVVHPRRFWSNATARAGDRLVLTKPLGTGILTSALKKGRLEPAVVERVTATMAALNRDACERAAALGGVSAATDVTGFGFGGHAGNMARASGVTFRVDARAVPVFEEALPLAKAGFKTRGDRQNRQLVEGRYRTAPSVPRELEDVLFDPQTSGGLLLAMEPAGAASMGFPVIGEVLPRQGDLFLIFD